MKFAKGFALGVATCMTISLTYWGWKGLDACEELDTLKQKLLEEK